MSAVEDPATTPEPFTNPDNPIVNIQRKGLRIVGNAYDISRVLEACRDAIKHIETNGGDITAPVTVVVRAPQDDEP